MYCNEHNDPFVTVFLVIVFIFFMYFGLYFLYDCWRLPHSRFHHIRNRYPTMIFFPTHPSHITSRGLDPAVVESLHVFTFSSDATHKDQIDCAVCLSEFEEGESGRVLPGCKHAFHVECIDMWFHSHSTCPLCRSLVEHPSTTVEEEVAIITVSSATEPVGSSAAPLEDSSRNPAAIETPRRSVSEFEQNLSANHSFTLPISQMLSFHRLLSKNRRSASSSSCQIGMTETDIERGEKILSDLHHVDAP